MKHFYRLMNEATTEPTGGGAPSPTPTPTPAPIEWSAIRENLPDDLKNDSSLATINSLESLVKSYVHSQKAMGNRVPIPDKHATPDDWQQFYRKLGHPEKLEEYKVAYKAPEGHIPNEEFINEVKAAAHKAGILPHQFETVVNTFLEKEAAFVKQIRERQETEAKAAVESLKKEWGPAFETKLKKANVALKELLPEEDRASLVGFENHPALTKLLATVADKFFKEDVFVGHGEGNLAGMTPSDALRKANDIMGDPNHPYRNPSHPNHRAAQKEVADLFSIAYPQG